MSHNPFHASAGIRLRIESLEATIGERLREQISALLAASRDATDNSGSVIASDDVKAMIEEYELGGVEELMLLALATATRMARPPISNFFVGAIGLERETGNLVFGCNVEFPGTHLGTTIHGEGFISTRSFSRGTSIGVLAIGEAHPCAHCRQYLSEFAASRELILIDPLGHRLPLSQLYPWPFDPAYLGAVGVVPGATYWPDLELEESDLEAAVANALLAAGRRSYSPYSKSPAGVVLALKGGRLISGSAIESVAFNPTIGPLQAAVIDLIAHGNDYEDIVSVALATARDGPIDYAASTLEIVETIAPGVPFKILTFDGVVR